MDFQIIPKQMDIPTFDSNAIKIHHIKYFEPPYKKYDDQEITEEVITKVMKRIPDGLNIYLF